MPLTAPVEEALLGLEFGKTTPTIPSTHYLGLFRAATWTASTSGITASPVTWIVPTNFPAPNGNANLTSQGRLFYCSAITTGTTGTTEPTWPQTAGGSVTDGGVTWTEASSYLAVGTNYANLEPPTSGGTGYTRNTSGLPNNTSTWPTPTATGPLATVSTNVVANFPAVSASWGQLVGGGGFDAATPGTGNLRWWGLFSAVTLIGTNIGVTPNVPLGSLFTTLD